jgi:hypothetical protein
MPPYEMSHCAEWQKIRTFHREVDTFLLDHMTSPIIFFVRNNLHCKILYSHRHKYQVYVRIFLPAAPEGRIEVLEESRGPDFNMEERT